VFLESTPNARIALDGVDLTLSRGSFCVVIGSNGAGKSTLLNAIAGRFLVGPGRILLDGEDVGREALHKRARHIARVFQDPMTGTAPAMSVEENLLLAELRSGKRRLRFGLTAGRRARYRERLAMLKLGLEDRLADRVETLSGGQRQAVAVARAAAFGSKVVILDEPTAALGVRETAQVLKLIRDLRASGKAIILISHDMPHVFELADRIHIQRLGARAAVITPKTHTMEDAVAIMTGARQGQVEADAQYPEREVASPEAKN